MTPTTSANLLRERRFGPIFWTQFLGAFNDNVFKNALVASIVFGATATGGEEGNAALVNLAAGLFILPFFLCSASAGVIADAVDKAQLVRVLKRVEIGVMLLAALGFALGSVPLLMTVLFLMGAQSAFFGPVKYSILPQHLAPNELVAANGMISAATFVAIIAGTLLGTVLPSLAVAAVVLALAVLGYLASRGVPSAPSLSRGSLRHNPLRESTRMLSHARKQPLVFRAILGISWFWLFGSLFLAQLPSVCTEILGGGQSTMAAFLVAFSLGVGLGSVGCSHLSRGRVEPTWILIGSVGMTVFGLDFCAAVASGSLARMLIDLFLLGAAGGLFVVPLLTLMQARSDEKTRSRTVAANNILNALFIVAGAVAAIAALGAGLDVMGLLAAGALVNIAVTIAVVLIARYAVLRLVLGGIVRTFYRVQASDMHHVPDDQPALLVCNHPSMLDAPIIASMCKRQVRFVMDHRTYGNRWLGWLFRAVDAIPIAPARDNPEMLAKAFDEIECALRNGEVVCIFPEGRLTRDGEIAEFRRGVDEILARTPVPVVPMALRGMWGSFYSRVDGAPMSGRFRGFRSAVQLRCGAALAPARASARALQDRVAALRGEVR